MKIRILKYNLIPMLGLFGISTLYNIGEVLNCLMMEIKFKTGEYAYKSTGMNGKFFQELYGQEWSLGYMFGAFVVLSLVAIITVLFYQKFLSKNSFVLLSLSVIPSALCVICFISEDIFPLTAILVLEAVYALLTVIFTLKDFIDTDADIDELDDSVIIKHMSKRDKPKLITVIVLFAAGSIYYFGRILSWYDAFDFLSHQNETELFSRFFIAEILMIAATALTVLVLKDKVSGATTALISIGTFLPACFVISLYGSPTVTGISICLGLYSLYIAASLFVAVRNMKRMEKTD